MSTVQDTDLLLVNRGGTDYKVTAKELQIYVDPPPPPWLPAYEGLTWHVESLRSGTDGLKIQNADIIYNADTFEVYTGSTSSPPTGTRLVCCGASTSFKNSKQDFKIHQKFTDTSKITSFTNTFYNCNKFRGDGLSYVSTASATRMAYMFNNCFALLGYGDRHTIDHFDLTHTTDIKFMFAYCTAFNGDISAWDVDQVQNFSGLFSHCENFNQDLSRWNMSSATDLSSMFTECLKFNGDVSTWNVSNVTSFGEVFANCHEFTGDVSSWDVSKGSYFNGMFNNAWLFNQDIGNWNTANAINMSYMFSSAYAFLQDLSGWCVTNIPSKPQSFYNPDTPIADHPEYLPKWGTCP